MIPPLDPLKREAIQCSLAAAVEAVGERWAFLILRGAFNGICHFEQFQQDLGIARNILSSRLAKLVEQGIMARLPCADDRRRVEYRLTEKGEALLPVVVALRQWGEAWSGEPPVNPVLVDARDRQPIAAMRVESHDGRALEVKDLRWAARKQGMDVRRDRSASARAGAGAGSLPESAKG